MPAFFDDAELLGIGLTLPTVNALRQAYENSTAGGTTILDLDETQQIALDAQGVAGEALELANRILTDLSNIAVAPDLSSDVARLSQMLELIVLQLSTVENVSNRLALLEQRFNDLELIAHGN